MAIPTLSTTDKSFICSYIIGSDVDHRKALGIINEITTFTSEYIDGFCWIPVCSPIETNDHSWYSDVPDKDEVYVKVGVRVSADGYLHAWLLDTQEVSELVLWNNRYDTTNQPIDDSTVLHWCIEKMYQGIFGNTTSFVAANIKFQNYVSGSVRLYLFGNYSNNMTHRAEYSGAGTVIKSGISWYPNNSTTILSDFLYTSDVAWSCWIRRSWDIDADGWVGFSYINCDKALLNDGVLFTDYTTEFENNELDDCPLIPAAEAVNDAFYYGSTDTFDIISLNIETVGVGGTIIWEYWNGSSWGALSVTDETAGFTNSGVNTVSYTIPTNWVLTTVNGSSLYWVRSRVTAANFTAQPIAANGTIHSSSVIWSKAREPIFVKVTNDSMTEGISSHCEPGAGASKSVTYCYDYLKSGTCIGNNSGRYYPMYFTLTTPPGCGAFVCDQISVTCVEYTIDEEPNRAYIWVPGYCSGASGGTQSECEANGGTWIPGHYACDPAFIYDSSVTFDYGKYTTVNAISIDYVNSRARFSGIPEGTKIYVDYGYPTTPIAFFDEYGGELDTLKHLAGSNIDANSIYTIFTKHVAFGLLVDNVDLVLTSDWVVTWGSTNYFSSWSVPDGLASRTPAVTNTPYTCPITHHDEFSVVSGEPVLGGFLYDLVTSNAFLSRDPGTETKILYPVCHDADFCFLYEFVRPSFSLLYHLKTDGDDTKDGLSWSEAWQTWSHMAQNLPDERTVLVKPGTYSGETQIGLTNSGVVFLVDINGVDNPAVVTVVLV